jgi:uroporphyrinogen-III synthase
MIPLISIRPEPGCTTTLAAARELGLEAVGFPLFAIRPLAWEPVAPDAVDALLLGSANAIRHGGAQLAKYLSLPVYAVGETTAAAAREAGFSVVASGRGGLQAMLDAIAPGTRLLRLAGAERVALSPPPGVTMIEHIAYASEPQPMCKALATMLAAPAVVALHSAEAAQHFAAECGRLHLSRKVIALATIGPRVSAAAGAGWATVATADEPSETALLAKARLLCQTPANDFREA